MRKFIHALFLLFGVCSAFAQVNGIYDHPYPRTMAFTMERIGRPEYAAKVDLVICDPRDSNAVKQVHILSPHTYCLPTRNWTQGAIFWKPAYDITTIPDAWKLRSSTGAFSQSDDGIYPIYDVTSYCPRYSGTVCGFPVGTAAGLGTGETYGEAIARLIVKNWSPAVWDGYSSDGTASTPDNEHFNSDYDIERNGTNAKTVHGTPWITTAWQAGWNAIFADIRTRLGSNNRLLLYHSIQDTFGLSWMNGTGMENSWTHAPHTFTGWKALQDQFDAASVYLPRVSWLEDTFKYDSLHAPARKHDYFRYMRFGLGACSMTNAYYTIGDPSAPGYSEHLWTSYFDEFDLNLGHATGASQQIGSTGVWVRFFDNGCVIVNTSSATRAVTNSDISGLTGYAGVYYRFKGNQDPTWNNGGVFSTASLTSSAASWPGASQYVGDALFLVKTPTTVISDIYLDNAYSATSPGSVPAGFTGTWNSDFSHGYPNNFWSNSMPQQPSIPKWWDDEISSSGTGSNTATFIPVINVTGNYGVYEWHGTHSSMATNVPARIYYASGTKDTTINQTTNTGQWNLLGTYTFNSGGTNKIVITNNANGNVMADAFKLVYISADSTPPVPPFSPCQSRVDSAYAAGVRTRPPCPTCPVFPDTASIRAQGVAFGRQAMYNAVLAWITVSLVGQVPKP